LLHSRVRPLEENMSVGSQTACVLLGLTTSAIVIALTIRFARKGRMHFDSVEWGHVTRGANGANSPGLAVFRLVYATFVLSTTIDALVEEDNYGVGLTCDHHILATFTVWSWIAIGLFGYVCGAATVFDCIGWSPGDKAAKFLTITLWVWFEVMTSMALLVFLVVWLILVPASPSFADPRVGYGVPFSMHNVNVCIVGIELMFNRFRFVEQHAVFVVCYQNMYMVFSWVFSLTTDRVCYYFADWKNWIAIPGYLLIYTIGLGTFFSLTCASKQLKGTANKSLQFEQSQVSLLARSDHAATEAAGKVDSASMGA